MSEEELKDMLDKVQNKIYPKHLAFKRINEKFDELLNLIEDTKNAYAWWLDEKYGEPNGIKCESDKSDYEHFEKLKEVLTKYGRTDHA